MQSQMSIKEKLLQLTHEMKRHWNEEHFDVNNHENQNGEAEINVEGENEEMGSSETVVRNNKQKETQKSLICYFKTLTLHRI